MILGSPLGMMNLQPQVLGKAVSTGYEFSPVELEFQQEVVGYHHPTSHAIIDQ